jgi:hypothetical protein
MRQRLPGPRQELRRCNIRLQHAGFKVSEAMPLSLWQCLKREASVQDLSHKYLVQATHRVSPTKAKVHICDVIDRRNERAYTRDCLYKDSPGCFSCHRGAQDTLKSMGVPPFTENGFVNPLPVPLPHQLPN